MVETYPQVLAKNIHSDAAVCRAALEPKAESFFFSVK